MVSLRKNRTLKAFVLATIGFGAVGGALAGVLSDGSGDLLFLSLLVVAGTVSERFKINLFGDCHVSLSAFVAMAAGVVGGPRDAVIVAALLGLLANVGGAVPAYKTLFNIAVYVLSALSFVAVVSLLTTFDGLASGPYEIAALTPAVMIDFALNAMLVAVVVALASNTSAVAVVRTKYLWLAPQYLPLGALVFVASIGYQEIGAAIVLVLAVPVAALQLGSLLHANLRHSYDENISEVEERIIAVQLELARVQSASKQRGAQEPAA